MINKPYKFKRNDFDQILFTSDTHYNHAPKWDIPLCKRRGFDSVEEHDRWLEDQYSKVSDKSIIFHLGDAALNSTPEKMLYLFNKTAAPIWFIFGNHFSPDYALYKSAVKNWLFESEQTDIITENTPLDFEVYPFNINRITPRQGSPKTSQFSYSFTYLGIQANIQINKTLIQLSHMAPRFWNNLSHGGWSLAGHSHQGCAAINLDNTSGKVLDIGVENSITYNKSAFFTYEDLCDIMSKKIKISEDHH